ncbi:MAG TPA: hypothetical protein VFF73_39645, partial [Planctomycetota bacterium]|nr:hypothetical protein [Planctomycetota bacterium]
KTIEEATAAGRGKKTVRVPAEIAQRVDALLGEIDKDVKATSLDALPQKFAELDRLMRWYEKLADDDEARAKLASWNKKLEDWKEIRQALKLDTALQIGNQCLRDMIAAKREVRFEDLVATFEEVRSLVSVMKEEKREEFDRNADAIFTRAKKILEEARAERESAPPPPPPK